MLSGGYVIIRRSSETEEGTEEISPGVIIGVSDYIKAGLTENFVVTLNEEEVTEVGEVMFAMLHNESSTSSENQTFDSSLNLSFI